MKFGRLIITANARGIIGVVVLPVLLQVVCYSSGCVNACRSRDDLFIAKRRPRLIMRV